MAITTANKHLELKAGNAAGCPKRAFRLGVPAVLSCFLVSGSVLANDWDFEPSVNVKTIYTDNVNLEATAESDFVTEVSPAISINREGRRLRVDLDYSLQNLLYQDNSDLDTTNHRLSADVKSEIVSDTLFLDFRSSLSQQLTDRRTSASSDGISGSANLSDVFTYSISPYWQQRLGNIAAFDLRFTHDRVKSNGSVGGSGDSDSNGLSLDLENGSATGKINWNLNYDVQDINYDDGSRSDTETANARLGYQLNRSVNAFLSATYENDNFSGSRGNSEPDDSTVGGGFTWTPSQDFEFTAIYNERLDPLQGESQSFFSGDVFWAPTARTDINLGYDNRFFGDAFSAAITHRARWTRWNLSYSEDTSDFRSLLLQRSLVVCPQGATSFTQCRVLAEGESPQPGETFVNAGQGLLGTISTSIANDTFIRKAGRASVSITGARNTVTLGVNETRREYVGDNRTEKDAGIDLSWSLDVAPRTVSLVTVSQNTEQFDDGIEDDFIRYTWRVSRELGEGAVIFIEAQFRERDTPVTVRRYDENRLTVSFEKIF